MILAFKLMLEQALSKIKLVYIPTLPQTSVYALLVEIQDTRSTKDKTEPLIITGAGLLQGIFIQCKSLNGVSNTDEPLRHTFNNVSYNL